MTREYPAKPIVGVGAVIICDNKILLVKRGSEPGKDKWSIPGGIVELGETVKETIVREVREETGLDVEACNLIDVVDNLEQDDEGRWRYHFVILDFFVRIKGGHLQAGSDVLEVRWVFLKEAEGFELTTTFRDFFERNREALRKFNPEQESEW